MDRLAERRKTTPANNKNCRVCHANGVKRLKSHKRLTALLDFQFKIAKGLACTVVGRMKHAGSKVYVIHFFLSDAHQMRVVSLLL